MKIAVTYENGQVFQHFGHSERFKIYEVANNAVVASEIIPTNGSGHGALADFLSRKGVSVLICGGIGEGAKAALAEAGIDLYGGTSGNADEQVAAYLTGTLSYNPDTQCSHHDHHDDNCGSENHNCSHHCGNH